MSLEENVNENVKPEISEEKKEENIHKAAVKTAALLRVWGIK